MYMLLKILFERRYLGDKKNDCLMTVDGTDFECAEQRRWCYSHKFGHSGLRYEVGISILSGDICWINGPYEAGRWNDISIFRDSLMSHLDDSERVEADDGYIGEHPKHIKCPKGFANKAENEFMQQRVRNRQETVNKRLKQFGILKQVYRHSIPNHGDVFRACAVLTQLAINDGDRLFACGYRDQHNPRADNKRSYETTEESIDEGSTDSNSL